MKLYNNKNFLLILIGSFISQIGSNIQKFAISLYVLKITGSASTFASVMVFSFIPNIVLAPLSGVIADWFNKKKIIVVLDFLVSFVILIYTFFFINSAEFKILYIYLFVLVLAIIQSFFNPAASSIIPLVVEKNALSKAYSIRSVFNTIGGLLSPVIAGFIMSFWGLLPILIINSISFFLSAISECFIKIEQFELKKDKNFEVFISDFKKGFAYIYNNKKLFSIIILSVSLNFTISPTFSIGIPYVLKEVFKVEDQYYGIFEAIVTSAMLISPFIASYLLKKVDSGKVIIYNLYFLSIFVLLNYFPTSNIIFSNLFNSKLPFIFLLSINFLLMIFVGIVNIAISTVMQSEIDKEYLGRVNSTSSALITASIPFGQIIFGMFFDTFEAWCSFVICGIAMVIVITLFKSNIIKKY